MKQAYKIVVLLIIAVAVYAGLFGLVKPVLAQWCGWVVTDCCPGGGCMDHWQCFSCGGDVYVAPPPPDVVVNTDAINKATTGCNNYGVCGFTTAPASVIDAAQAGGGITVDLDAPVEDGGGGSTVACTGNAECTAVDSSLSCRGGVCGKSVTNATGVCPDGYTNLPLSASCTVLVQDGGNLPADNCTVWCIQGVPGIVDDPGNTCTMGQRTACGDSLCGGDERMQRICGENKSWGDGTNWNCVATDACAPARTDGQACQPGMAYGGYRITDTSGTESTHLGEESRGVFVGCQGSQNCFCQGTVTNPTGTVQCYPDPGGDSCGANAVPAVPQPSYPPGGGEITTVASTPPTPPQGVLCTSIASIPVTPVLGASLALTCNSTADVSVDHFEFRYQVGGGTFTNLTAGTAQLGSGAYSGNSQLTVSQAGTYVVQCRVCRDGASTQCTNWGMDQ